MNAIKAYFQDLVHDFGNGWNAFWFRRVDPLPVSVIRILTGVLAMYAVASYGPDLVPLFGPDGLLSEQTVRDYTMDRWGFSLLDYLHSPAELMGGYVFSLVVLALFTLGVYTRITNVLGLICYLSFLHRAPMLVTQFESVLAMLLVYLCLSPSGAYLSVDRWLARRRRSSADDVAPSMGANIALRLMQIHLCLIYLMMGLAKLGQEVWWEGLGMWWLMARYETAPFNLTWLHERSYWLNAWSHLIVFYEVLFPIGIWNRFARPLLLLAAPLVMLLIALPTGLFAYGLVMLTANLVFVPGSAMRLVLERSERKSASISAPDKKADQVAVTR